MVDAHANLVLKSRTALVVRPNSADIMPAPTNPRWDSREPNSSNAPFANFDEMKNWQYADKLSSHFAADEQTRALP